MPRARAAPALSSNPHDGLPLPKAKVSGAKQETAGFVFVGPRPFPLPRPPSMPVDRELVLFCWRWRRTCSSACRRFSPFPSDHGAFGGADSSRIDASSRHPGADHSVHLLGEQLGSGAALSPFLCTALAKTFKAHSVTLAVAKLTYHVLHALLDVTTAVIVQAVVVWAVYASSGRPRTTVSGGPGLRGSDAPWHVKAFRRSTTSPRCSLSRHSCLPRGRAAGRYPADPADAPGARGSDRVVFSYEVILVVCSGGGLQIWPRDEARALASTSPCPQVYLCFHLILPLPSSRPKPQC